MFNFALKIVSTVLFFLSIGEAATIKLPMTCIDKNPSATEPIMLKLVQENQQPVLLVGNKVENWPYITGIQLADMIAWWTLDLDVEQTKESVRIFSSSEKSKWAKVNFTLDLKTGEGIYSGTAKEPNPTSTDYGFTYIQNYPVKCSLGAEQ